MVSLRFFVDMQTHLIASRHLSPPRRRTITSPILCSLLMLFSPLPTNSYGETYIPAAYTHPLHETPLQKDTTTTIVFCEKTFLERIEVMLDEAKQWLIHAYKTPHITVRITDHHRDIQTQQSLVHTWKSKTYISLHNYGAAVDIMIAINGKRQPWTTSTTLRPYQIVGYFARKHGFFRWRAPDSWHIGETEYIHELINRYPHLRTHHITKAICDILTTSPSLDRRYEAFFESIDYLYTGTYTDDTDHRSYLDPINPYEKN